MAQRGQFETPFSVAIFVCSLYLVCLVTFKMQQTDPTINSKIVLERIFQKKLDNTREGLDDFLITSSLSKVSSF